MKVPTKRGIVALLDCQVFFFPSKGTLNEASKGARGEPEVLPQVHGLPIANNPF